VNGDAFRLSRKLAHRRKAAMQQPSHEYTGDNEQNQIRERKENDGIAHPMPHLDR
jgi:hypothetical protein